MIVEPCLCPSTSSSSNKYQQNQYSMAMNKPSIKQNGHLNTNENLTDNDYGGGGKVNPEIS